MPHESSVCLHWKLKANWQWSEVTSPKSDATISVSSLWEIVTSESDTTTRPCESSCCIHWKLMADFSKSKSFFRSSSIFQVFYMHWYFSYFLTKFTSNGWRFLKIRQEGPELGLRAHLQTNKVSAEILKCCKALVILQPESDEMSSTWGFLQSRCIGNLQSTFNEPGSAANFRSPLGTSQKTRRIFHYKEEIKVKKKGRKKWSIIIIEPPVNFWRRFFWFLLYV